ncbi:MAG: DUF669 domain-containing protein [Xanthobacteraceae bacterium]
MARISTRVEVTEENTTQRSFENLPDGVYLMEITASDSKEEENPRKYVLKTTMDIIEPEQYAGRKIFNNYNLENPNPQAQEIGQKQFSCLLRALEMGESPEESDELHFKKFAVTIGMGKESKDKQYPARNEIKRYWYPDEDNTPEFGVKEPANDNRPAPSAANNNRNAAAAAKAKPVAAGTVAAASAGKARPWSKAA